MTKCWPRQPASADTSIRLISRTLRQDQLVDEMIFSFTHTEEMPWMLPGIRRLIATHVHGAWLQVASE